MSWTKVEKEEISWLRNEMGELGKCVFDIKAAIVGELKEDKPGIQDRLRVVEQRQRYVFLVAVAALLGFVINMTNGNIEKLITWMIRLIV